ncbi:MAG: twin-arginine translocase TatA/TatE family subunit [Acidobacteriales bacterium]|nr:twin-arginine translocase TatA/TatE family subunit [Terriglobales bacterium]
MSFGEMFFLVFLALIVFGPKRLPEMARKLGKIMGEFRRASQEFRSQIEEEVRKLELDEATRGMGIDLKNSSNAVSHVPLDQQILPPTRTEDVVEHPVVPPVETTQDLAPPAPANGHHA